MATKVATDYTSPRRLLRARRFRLPGLVDWEVFNISTVITASTTGRARVFFLKLYFSHGPIEPKMGVLDSALSRNGWFTSLIFVQHSHRDHYTPSDVLIKHRPEAITKLVQPSPRVQRSTVTLVSGSCGPRSTTWCPISPATTMYPACGPNIAATSFCHFKRTAYEVGSRPHCNRMRATIPGPPFPPSDSKRGMVARRRARWHLILCWDR